jgi:hypothetical protein
MTNLIRKNPGTPCRMQSTWGARSKEKERCLQLEVKRVAMPATISWNILLLKNM